ncbi:hypothetical protein J7L01_04935 [bacterium]|nr:hypothetical protein [bacterium]
MSKWTAVSIILFSAALSIYGQEIAISTAAGLQFAPAVATDGTDFFATWEDARAGTGNPNIYGRLVSADGTLPGLESPVCAFTGYQKIPEVAWGGSHYLDVWFDRRTGYQVYGNLVDSDGTLYLGNFPIVTVDGSVQNIAVSGSDNGFLVIWEARIFGLSDIEFCITKEDMSSTIPMQLGEPDGNEKNPAAARADSFWVVVYEDSSGLGKGIYGQRISYGIAGTDTTWLYPVVSVTHEESSPAIAHGDDGFMVVFERDGGTTGRDIFGILLDATGAPEGMPFPISTYDGNQVKPCISYDGVGYLVAWQDSRDLLSDIYGQRVSDGGTLIGAEIAISTASGTQQKVSSTCNGDHHLVIWEDSRGATTDIYATRIDAMSASSAPEVTVLQPLPFVTTSCNRYPVELLLVDPDGIDQYSLSFFNGTDTINGYSSSIVLTGDTLRYSPTSDWPNGVPISLSLVDIADSLGNHIDSPVEWSFTADLTSPIIDNKIPRDGQVLDSFPSSISANLSDSVTGIDPSTIIFVLDGDTFAYPDPYLSWDGFTIRLTPDAPAIPRGTHTVTVRVGDSPDVCDPNFAAESWDFYVNPGGGPNATAIQPRSGDVVASATPEIQILLTDEDGVDESTIEVSVGGIVYLWPSAALSFDDSILTIDPTATYTHDQTVIVNLLHAEDGMGTDIESPLVFSFVVDLEPPVFGDYFPATDGTLHVGIDDVWIVANDAPAGIVVDPEHVSFSFYDLSMSLLESPSGGLTARGDTVVLQSGAFGSHLGDDVDVIVCAEVADDPDWYSPNDTTFCWQVHVDQMAISERKLPSGIELSVSPNPFNSAVNITIRGVGASDARSGQVGIEIFDISGRLVADLPVTNCGEPQFVPTPRIWRPDESISSGIYLVRARTIDGNCVTKRIVYLK